MSNESETGWSREKPTVDGIYWWRASPADDESEIGEVAFGCFYQIEKQSEPLENYGGEWLGPITPADFEQLVRLREAARAALENIQGIMDGNDIPSMVVRDMLRVALRLYPNMVARKEIRVMGDAGPIALGNEAKKLINHGDRVEQIRTANTANTTAVVQCADCLAWIDRDINHTCRQQVQRNRRSAK